MNFILETIREITSPVQEPIYETKFSDVWFELLICVILVLCAIISCVKICKESSEIKLLRQELANATDSSCLKMRTIIENQNTKILMLTKALLKESSTDEDSVFGVERELSMWNNSA
jgi:hypothetical protein